ncbi:MAG: hypothetical protein V4622_01200 [Bacteroidota bacterium]
MKSILLTALLLLSAQFVSAQLISGTLMDEGRKLTSTFDFKIHGKFKGIQTFKIAVNALGDVTSVVLVETEGNLVSTPAKIVGVKELKKLKFTGATYYPKFQHVTLKVEFLK